MIYWRFDTILLKGTNMDTWLAADLEFLSWIHFNIWSIQIFARFFTVILFLTFKGDNES